MRYVELPDHDQEEYDYLHRLAIGYMILSIIAQFAALYCAFTKKGWCMIALFVIALVAVHLAEKYHTEAHDLVERK